MSHDEMRFIRRQLISEYMQVGITDLDTLRHR